MPATPEGTKPRRFTVQWFVQQAFWLLAAALFIFIVYLPGALIGPVS